MSGRPVAVVSALLLVAAVAATSGSACDLCALYSATQARTESMKGWVAGVAEQFTHFGTLQIDGQEGDNPEHQRLDSSITQLLLGYNFSDRFGLQASIPIAARWFRRPEGAVIGSGSESGLGDITLSASYHLYRRQRGDSALAGTLLGGIKCPTGDTFRLQEETTEPGGTGGGVPSAIHGHDLTLGSGSIDGLVGVSLFGRWHRGFVAALVQYSIRSEGDYQYRFANDLVWSAAPGYFLVLNDDYTVAAEFSLSGETKGRDRLAGTIAEDTGLTAVYAGPQLSATWQEKLTAQLGLDLPLLLDNSSLQIVPDYRVRAAVTWRF